MSNPVGCVHIQDLLPDLVAGAASAADQRRASQHVAECQSCRRALDEAEAVAGELLTLLPAQEPPAGFDAAVLRGLRPAKRPAKRPARRRAALIAAVASVVAAAISAVVIWQAGTDDRTLANAYRDALAAGNGQFLLAQKLRTPDGSAAGVVFCYQGNPSWILIVVERPGPYEVELISRTGAIHRAGTLVSSTWATAIDLPVHDLTEVRLHRAGDTTSSPADLVAVIKIPAGLG